jgi:hypothetical protein
VAKANTMFGGKFGTKYGIPIWNLKRALSEI